MSTRLGENDIKDKALLTIAQSYQQIRVFTGLILA